MDVSLDVGRAIWIVSLSIGIFSASRLRCGATSTGELVARILLLFIVAVPLMAAADLLNWATALCLSGGSIAVTGCRAGPTAWLRRAAGADPWRWRTAVATWVHARALDRRVRATGSLALVSATGPLIQSLLNVRLPSAEYAVLKRAHELMSGTGLDVRFPEVSLVALVSIVSTADPLHVVRFLKPVFHGACTLAVELLVRRATKRPSLAYATATVAGVALLGVQSSADLLALTMLVSGLGVLAQPGRHRFNAIGACGVLTMCAFTVPSLGIVAIAAVVVLAGLPRRYTAEGLGVVFLAAMIAEPRLLGGPTSPAPLFIAIGTALASRRVLTHLVTMVTRTLRSTRFTSAAVLGVLFCLSCVSTGSQYLEPDSSPRQALALKDSVSRHRWMVVGTPAQRIQIGPIATVMDLQEFVARYHSSVAAPDFRFDLPVERIYVFVEKRTVIAPPTGPVRQEADLERAVYRIPRLRAELQRTALELCESYQSAHEGVSIYYEDEELRIYSFEVG